MAQSPTSARLRLESQVSVVTGGARGIGAGIVKRFVEEGAGVVFSDLLDDKAKHFENELVENAAFCRADSMSLSDVEALMAFAVARFGRLDCIVNNAGSGWRRRTYRRNVSICHRLVQRTCNRALTLGG
jgi:NAD(P)-dependent dehydrogenase (short-subunit alcohol dehydrogenase family)